MTETPDTAGVIAPPPLMLAAAIVLGLVLDWLLPVYVLAVLLSFGARIVIGVILIAAGASLAVPGMRGFRAAGTPSNHGNLHRALLRRASSRGCATRCMSAPR